MLSDLMVRQAKTTGKTYTLADSDGLSLFVAARRQGLGTSASPGAASAIGCPSAATRRSP